MEKNKEPQPQFQTPDWIKRLHIPTPKKMAGRKVWGLDLETVILPFYVASNTVGDTNVPHSALGAPIRLAIALDGSIRFGKSGRPLTRIAKELAEQVRIMREQYIAGLGQFTEQVRQFNPDGYKAEIALCVQAGKPIIEHDRQILSAYITAQAEQAAAAAEAKAKAKAEAEAKAKDRGKVKVTA